MEFNLTLDEFFNWLKRLAIGIQAVVGPNCEIVLHDFRDLEHSVIAIEGSLSGRKTGAPLPDMQFMDDIHEPFQQDQINYQIQIGRNVFQSSTIWIQNHEGQALGALCINMDYSKFEQIQSLLETFLQPLRQDPQFVIRDSFAKDTRDLIHKAIHSIQETNGTETPADLPAFRKKAAVQMLEKNGLFNLRGSVEEVCEILQISRATVYNYRKG